jgi:protein gp37
MGETTIEWATHVWNPVTGCSKVSPGCAHCYAETVTAMRAGRPGFIADHLPWTPANAAHNVTLWPDRVIDPLHWRKPRPRVFVNSMSDLFHDQVPVDFIARVFSVMAKASQHSFLILTKRPERMLELLGGEAFWWKVCSLRPSAFADRELAGPGNPLPNVWLGVSIENRRFIHRADVLRETPAAVRFISAEPLLGPLMVYEEPQDGYPAWDWSRSLNLVDIDWLIVGGESGKGHRPMHPDWVRDLRELSDLTGTAFFFKQWGGRTPKAGGRELDGRTWDELPALARVTA